MTDIELAPWGWAPGGYSISCTECPKDLHWMERGEGAKRSYRCYKHAKAARERSLMPVDSQLGPQVRPLSETFSGFQMVRDTFAPKAPAEPMPAQQLEGRDLVQYVAGILEEWDMREPPDACTGHSYEEIARDVITKALAPLKEREARLEEALKPFAEAADDLDESHKDKSNIWEAAAAMSITAGDLRRAKSLVPPAATPTAKLEPKKEPTLFNTNNYVRVKLNERGMEILKREHAELQARWPSAGEFTPPKTDADGWSKWQLWVLMRTFGPHIHLGRISPFGTTIEIPEGQ